MDESEYKLTLFDRLAISIILRSISKERGAKGTLTLSTFKSN